MADGMTWILRDQARGHHESDAKYYGRREHKMGQTHEAEASTDAAKRGRLGPLPGGGKAVLRVSIPVKVGGFTGQRDQWQETERDYNVILRADGVIVLKDAASSAGTQIVIDRAGLQAALAVLEDYQA